MSTLEKIVAGAFIIAMVIGIYLAVTKKASQSIPGPDGPQVDDKADKKDIQ
jgi:hypothetical protein